MSDIHELFRKAYLTYSKRLEKSITEQICQGHIKNTHKDNYNYLLIDNDKLYELLDIIDNNNSFTQKVQWSDVDRFKKCIIYIGKGRNRRKLEHLISGSKMLRQNTTEDISSKYSLILRTWNRGSGIIALQIYSNSENYMSCCREKALIRAAHENITNVRDGSAYGAMMGWTDKEIYNYGEILLYLALKQCMNERPSPYFPKDFRCSKRSDVFEPKKYFIRSNYELNGILDYFLEL